MMRFGISRILGMALIVIGFVVSPVITAMAVPVVLDVNGYGYNTIDGSGKGYDGLTGAIGCGPTTGAMIMEYYSRHGAPGLITDPLADARLMGAGPINPINTTPLYMNTNSDGSGTPLNFQNGFVKFAQDRGYNFTAALHVEPTTFNAASWPGYTQGVNLITDANFWNTSTWQINPIAFLDFIKPYIDAGQPLSASVYGDPNFASGTILDTGYTSGGATHWMPLIGYDLTPGDADYGMWAGLNTWDNSVHWYSPTSAFYDTIAGGNFNVPNMSIAYVRSFDLLNPYNGGDDGDGTKVPEPSIMVLFGAGLAGFGLLRKRFKS